MIEVLDTFSLDWLHDVNFSARGDCDPRASKAYDRLLGADRLRDDGRVGDLRDAENGYRNALKFFEELVSADAENLHYWQHGISVCHNRIGQVQQAQGNLAAALTSFHTALAVAEHLVEADPGRWEWQHGPLVCYGNIGGVQQAQGNLAAALASFHTSSTIAERLAKGDPANTACQHALFVSHIKIGEVQQAQGNLAAALTSHLLAFPVAERLAKADPDNADCQHVLLVSHTKIGEVQQAQGNLMAALKRYRAALSIADHLAKADPEAALPSLSDRRILHDRIGEVQQTRGNLVAARTSYRAALSIAERLAKADPDNTEWQRVLFFSHDTIGQVQQAQGDLATARTSYCAAFEIAESQARTDPGNAEWRNDLASSRKRLIEVGIERQARQDSDLVSPGTVHDNPVPGETTPRGEPGSPRARSALPVPEAAGHELTRQKKSVATHYRLDAEELHLSAMAAVAGSEVAARAVSADPEELRELRDVRRLWNLRLDLHQKSKVAAGFPELLNEAQYRFAKSLEKTANEIRTLEVKLFGPDRVSEKGEIVSEIKRRASDYEYEPKRVRPRRERNSSSQLLRKVNG